jgi:sec-independent protein translocase protein TatA
MGGGEIVLILFVFMLLFGADSIPGIARTLGKVMREFQKATNEIKREITESGGGITDDIRDIRSTVNNIKSDITEGIRKHTGDIQEEIDGATKSAEKSMYSYASDIENEVSDLGASKPAKAQSVEQTLDNGANI